MASAVSRECLQRIDAWLAKAVMVVCVVFLGLIVVNISASVFSRFVIFTPLNFADPLSKYLMQWMAFLGVGLAVRSGEHVVVDMLVLSLPPKARKILTILLNLLLSGLFLAILCYGLVYAWSGRNASNPFVFEMPMIIPYLSVPVGALYALIQTNLTTWLALTAPEIEPKVEHARAEP